MRFILTSTVLLVAMAATSAVVPSAAPGVMQAQLKWGPAPPVFPRGAEMAVMLGDPTGTGPFTVRLRMPDGYRIAPHTRPTDEHLTVVSGTFRVGMGRTADTTKMKALAPGGVVTAPAGHAHYAAAQGETVVQVSATGPFALTYVNPADLPRAAR